MKQIERLAIEGAFGLFGEDPKDLNTKTRKKTIVMARSSVVHWLRNNLNYKPQMIADLFEMNVITPYRLLHEHNNRMNDNPVYRINYGRYEKYMEDILNPQSTLAIQSIEQKWAKKFSELDAKYDTLKRLFLDSKD
mgnify:CR=1 FL=1